MTHPLRLYADGLRRVREPGMRVQARLEDGTVVPLAFERYVGAADETDEQILRALRGPVLDVGCGPGRHLHALARRGVFALGVDLSPVAVELARGGGGHAIVASIFDELPGQARGEARCCSTATSGSAAARHGCSSVFARCSQTVASCWPSSNPRKPRRPKHARGWRHLMARAPGSPGHGSPRRTSTRSPARAASKPPHPGPMADAGSPA